MSTSVITDTTSPWFSGHFPGDPIFPGIAQLEMVADLIGSARQDELRITSLSRVKFRKIVRPGEQLDIQATAGNKENQYNFKITSGNEDVCSGIITLQPSSTVTESS